jgi:hypothetical protein
MLIDAHETVVKRNGNQWFGGHSFFEYVSYSPERDHFNVRLVKDSHLFGKDAGWSGQHRSTFIKRVVRKNCHAWEIFHRANLPEKIHRSPRSILLKKFVFCEPLMAPFVPDLLTRIPLRRYRDLLAGLKGLRLLPYLGLDHRLS